MLAVNALLAQGRFPQSWGFVEMAIALVVILAVCGLVMISCKVCNMYPPQWLWQVIGIVVAAVVIIWAIRFVAGM